MAPPTAAIPQKGKMAPALEKPTKAKAFPKIDPVAVPINNAGAKIPPNNPEPRQRDVNKIFKTRIVIIKLTDRLPPSIFTMLSVPNPKTCGKIAPVKPHMVAPEKIRAVGEIFKFGSFCINHLILNIKIIALIANNGLQIKEAGSILASSGVATVVSKADEVRKIFSVTALAVKLAIAIGARALIEKCLRIASCAKIIPARGAPKPAEIAPATPHPRKTSIERRSRVNFFNVVPIVPPK